MANIKSAKKRILVNRTKAARNKSIRSAVKTSIKKVETAFRKTIKLLHRLLLQRLSLQSAKQHLKVFITKITVQEKFPVCLKLSTALANSGNIHF